jgi:hypothetical protein
MRHIHRLAIGSSLCLSCVAALAVAESAKPQLKATGARPGAVAADDDKDAAKGVIKGSVQKNGRALKNSRITVEIVGLGAKFKKKVGNDGTFEFTEVPDGAYVLKAKGSFKNSEVAGETPDVKPAAADKAEATLISVE